MKLRLIIFGFLALLALGLMPQHATAQQQRFPMPEFHTEYEIPDTTRPEPRASSMEYVDLFVLMVVLGLTAWMVYRKRSRKGIFWLAVFSLIYFGFYRNGCICAVGAVQNLALSLFNDHYAISISALAFFAIPLFVALVAGRLFCAAACPLGAIQDLLIFKPIRLAPWLQKALGLFPFVYLGLAVLYAATGTSFIICRYDPFVGIFRMGAEFHMVMLGGGFLVAGMFVARPYCRFVCPYGAMLKIFSRYSKHHLSITPEDCVNCHLCKDSCPFGAIDTPTAEKDIAVNKMDFRRFLIYIVLVPVLMGIGGWAVSGSYRVLSSAHPDVSLAKQLTANPALMETQGNLDIDTFMASGRTLEMLVADASVVQGRFRRGGWFLGGFLGLVIGLALAHQVVVRRRKDYEANRGNCYSCGRCMDFCPVGKPDHPWHLENQTNNQIQNPT